MITILGLLNVQVYFDDFSVTGEGIPDGGPGLGKAAELN
jgi:hypothetical protein